MRERLDLSVLLGTRRGRYRHRSAASPVHAGQARRRESHLPHAAQGERRAALRSRLVFDRQGYLYVTLGERGDQDRAQRMDEHLGKIVRLHDDGRIPRTIPSAHAQARNPRSFAGQPQRPGRCATPGFGRAVGARAWPAGRRRIERDSRRRELWLADHHLGRNYGTGTKIGEGTQKPGMAHRCTIGCRRSPPPAWRSTAGPSSEVAR